jgi:hypothetical protein
VDLFFATHFFAGLFLCCGPVIAFEIIAKPDNQCKTGRLAPIPLQAPSR